MAMSTSDDKVLMCAQVVDSSAQGSNEDTSHYLETSADSLRNSFNNVLADYGDAEIIESPHGVCLAVFSRVSDAVRAAISFQTVVRAKDLSNASTPAPSIGIHVGDVLFDDVGAQRTILPACEGLQIGTGLSHLAVPGQILLTRAAFDNSRQFVHEDRSLDVPEPLELMWVAHGSYSLKGVPEPLEVNEVGVAGNAPLTLPESTNEARCVSSPDEVETHGWRPAVGSLIPKRDNWRIVRKLGDGGVGEVWLAQHQQTHDSHVFKFCFDSQKLEVLRQQEETLRQLRDSLNDRQDIASHLQISLEKAPFYLESEYIRGGSLDQWAGKQGGIDKVPLPERIQLIANVARALSVAHSAGVLHKDLKPSNVLIDHKHQASSRPILTDFGIGVISVKSLLGEHNRSSSTDSQSGSSNDWLRTETIPYLPLDAAIEDGALASWDLHALGVLLFQLIIGDLSLPLIAGWENAIEDELLVSDIRFCISCHPSERLDIAAEIADRLENLESRREDQTAIHVPKQDDGSDISTAHRLTDRGSDLTVDHHSRSPNKIPVDRGFTPAASADERYVKIQPHASGGLGTVFLARDAQIRRQVALKELKEQQADDPEKQRRFLLEGEVTGALEHPGIVPVYSLGVDSIHRPFYAMRFVKGKSLRKGIREFHESDHARDKNAFASLPFRRLLQRFLSVCHAIEYAHSRGVLHCDIKPSNVMLGKYGETYVVDWGLARIRGNLHEDRDGDFDSEEIMSVWGLQGSTDTSLGSALGTPAFMSPEQAMGNTHVMGPATDVYSLGATLYYMLTSRAAFEGNDILDLIKRVSNGEFNRPNSIRTDIPKKLEAICMKAMARDRGCRYPSAAALAQDIEHWLADEPVSASPDTLSERAMRFLRHHRTWVMSGMFALMVITAISVLATMVVNRARNRAETLAEANANLAASESEARELAEERFQKTRETVDVWLTGFTESLRNYPGVSNFRRQMLERAASDYENFVSESSGDPSLALEQARTLIRLGDLRRSLMQPEKAQSSYQRSIDSLQNVKHASDTESRLLAAKARGRLALCLFDLGKHSEAEDSYQNAADTLLAMIEAEDAHEKAIAVLAAIRINFGNMLLSLDEVEKASREFENAVVMLRQESKIRPNDLELRRNLATAKLGLGMAYLKKGLLSTADKQIESALGFYDALVLLDSKDPKSLEQRSSAYLFSASAKRQRGDFLAEAKLYEAAIKDYESLSNSFPEAVVYRENLALTETDLGQLWLEQDEPLKAIPKFEQASSTLASMISNHPAVPRFYEEQGISLGSLGHSLIVAGEYSRGFKEAAKARDLFRSLSANFPKVPEYSHRLAVTESHLAQSLYFQGELEDSVEVFRTAVDHLENLVREHPTTVAFRNDVALVHAKIGQVLAEWGESKKAAEHFESSDQHWTDLVGLSTNPAHLNNAAWYWLNAPLAQQRDYEKASGIAGRIAKAVPSNKNYRATLALAHYRLGKHEECVRLLELMDSASIDVDCRSLFIGALAMLANGQEDQARQLFHRAERTFETSVPGNWDLSKLHSESKKLFEEKVEKSTGSKSDQK